jgi:hypothetical protein
LISDDMNLQDIFKKFYAKTKESTTGGDGMLNSAKSSLNSFSSKLEKRRQAAKKARKSKEEGQPEEAEKDESVDNMKA